MSLSGMRGRLEENSIFILLIGVIMASLGGYIWFNSEESLKTVALYLGAALIVTGICYPLSLFRNWSSWSLTQGMADFFIGVIFIVYSSKNSEAIPLMFAFWTLFVGLNRMVATFHLLRNDGPHWFWTLLSGLLGICSAFVLIFFPGLWALPLQMYMGAYLVCYGLVSAVEYFASRQ